MLYRFYFFTFYNYYRNSLKNFRYSPSVRASILVSLSLFIALFDLLIIILKIQHIVIENIGLIAWPVAVALFILNHFLFIRHDRYKKIDDEFRENPINTITNRSWCWVFCIIAFLMFFPIVLWSKNMSVMDMPLR